MRLILFLSAALCAHAREIKRAWHQDVEPPYEATEVDDDLYGKDGIMFDGNRENPWMATHWKEIITIGLEETSTQHHEIFPMSYYKQNYNSDVFNPDARPLLLSEVQETLQEILQRDMLEKLQISRTFHHRPDGLSDIGLVFIAEVRFTLSLTVARGSKGWDMNFMSKGTEPKLRKIFGGSFKVFRERLEEFVKQHYAKHIATLRLNKNVLNIMKALGIQFAVRLRFSVACPYLVKPKTLEASQSFRARVVLITAIPVLPTNRLRVSDAQTANTELFAEKSGQPAKRFHGGVALDWSPWTGLMVEGVRPLGRKPESTLLGQYTKRVTALRKLIPFQVQSRRLGMVNVPPEAGLSADSYDRRFRTRSLNGKDNPNLKVYAREPLRFTCLQKDLYTPTREQNKLAREHCVYLPVFVHQLLPEEEKQIYLGKYPADTEVLYIRVQIIPGHGPRKRFFHRKCTDAGWEMPGLVTNSATGKKRHDECVSSQQADGDEDLNELHGDKDLADVFT